MTAAVVTEVWDGRSGALNSQRERNYTRSFKVLVSDASLGWEAVRLATGLPRIWNPYVNPVAGTADLGSFCQTIEGRQNALDPYLWEVTASYTNRIERPDLNLPENPLLRPTEISYDGTPVMVVAEHDAPRNGQRAAIRNSAGDMFDPPLEIEEYRLVMTFTRNQLTYDALGYLSYFNAVNRDEWFGFKPGSVKCVKISGTRQYENGVLFWRVTFEFHVRLPRDESRVNEPGYEAWETRVLDRGYFTTAGGSKKHILDPYTGQPIATPALLDGGGGVLPLGVEPEWLTFYLYRQMPFAALNLP